MNDDIYAVFGKKVRELREEMGLSQGELAEKAGVFRSELSSFEKDGSRIRGADRINQILTALGFELQIGKKNYC